MERDHEQAKEEEEEEEEEEKKEMMESKRSTASADARRKHTCLTWAELSGQRKQTV